MKYYYNCNNTAYFRSQWVLHLGITKPGILKQPFKSHMIFMSLPVIESRRKSIPFFVALFMDIADISFYKLFVTHLVRLIHIMLLMVNGKTFFVHSKGKMFVKNNYLYMIPSK